MNIFSIDAAPTHNLGISGSEQGQAKLWNLDTGETVHELKGHHGDLTLARFFPSGKVALTAAQDLRLKVWATANGKLLCMCAVDVSLVVFLVKPCCPLDDLCIFCVLRLVCSDTDWP